MLKLAMATLVIAAANFAATYPALAAACCQLGLGCCGGGPCCGQQRIPRTLKPPPGQPGGGFFLA